MAFKKILVPTDGSEFTKAAIAKAMDLAKLSGGTITAVYVVDQSIFRDVPTDTAVMNVYHTLEKEGKAAVAYVENLGEKQGVKVESKIIEGIPVKIIPEMSGDYDVIVMGTLGRSGVSKLLMGSVTEKVIRSSRSPVMVVRSVEADKK